MALTEQITDGVHRVADGIVNWYLVNDGGEIALYDAGWPRSWPMIESALEEIGCKPSDLSTVMLTHAHPDHLGAAEQVRKVCSCSVHVHAPEEARAHGKAKGSNPFTLVPSLLPTLWRPSATAFVLRATMRGFMFPTWVQDVVTFAADGPIDVPGRPVAIPTPGHTEGHVAFVLADRGVAITGDSIATLNVLTRERGPQLMPDQLNGDPKLTRQSLDAVAGLAVDTLLPGHGEPFRGAPSEAVERAQERDRQRSKGAAKVAAT